MHHIGVHSSSCAVWHPVPQLWPWSHSPFTRLLLAAPDLVLGLRDEVADGSESDWASLGQGARSEWLQCCPCPWPSAWQGSAPSARLTGSRGLFSLSLFFYFSLKWKRLYFIFFNPTNDFKMGVPVPFLCTGAGVVGPLIQSRLRVWPGWLKLRHLTIPRGNFLSHDWQSKRWRQAF